MKWIKESILEIPEYKVPQSFDVVKLNQNESPLDVPDELKSFVLKKLAETPWHRYPDGAASGLIEKISGYTNFPKEGIMVANASNEVIQTLVYALCDSGDSIVTITPGFSVYGRVAQIMNIKNIEVPLCENYDFDVPKIIEAAQDAKLVVLASPNNPTATIISPEDIETIANSISGVLAIDEAYFEFYKTTMQELVHKYPNLVVIRTFSKALRFSSARLGYMLGSPDMIREMTKARLPFSIGIFQQVAGEILLDHMDVFQDVIDTVIGERQRVFGALKMLDGVRPVPSFTNFILMESTRLPALQLFEEMYKRGVLIRYFGGEVLGKMLRITIGTTEENDIMLDKLNEILR